MTSEVRRDLWGLLLTPREELLNGSAFQSFIGTLAHLISVLMRLNLLLLLLLCVCVSARSMFPSFSISLLVWFRHLDLETWTRTTVDLYPSINQTRWHRSNQVFVLLSEPNARILLISGCVFMRELTLSIIIAQSVLTSSEQRQSRSQLHNLNVNRFKLNLKQQPCPSERKLPAPVN